jgi:hypothetical protein
VEAIEELNDLNLLQICEMLVSCGILTSIYHAIALSMHGSLFVLFNFFIMCRFEARAIHHNNKICKFCFCWYVLIRYHLLGNDFCYFN